MAIKAVINTSPGNRVAIDSQQKSTVRTIGIGVVPAGAEYDELAKLKDVVTINPANNETLVYDSTTAKYTIKTLPIVDGGSF
jgi:hypothetical protein